MGKNKNYCYSNDYSKYEYSDTVIKKYMELLVCYITSTTKVITAYNEISKNCLLTDTFEYNCKLELDRINIYYSTNIDEFDVHLLYEDYSRINTSTDITNAESILLQSIYKTIEKFNKPVRKKAKLGKEDDIETLFSKYVFMIQTYLTADILNNNPNEPVSFSSNMHIGRLYFNTYARYFVLDYIEGTSGPERIELIEKNREKLEFLATPLEMRLVNFVLGFKEMDSYYSKNN